MIDGLLIFFSLSLSFFTDKVYLQFHSTYPDVQISNLNKVGETPLWLKMSLEKKNENVEIKELWNV